MHARSVLLLLLVLIIACDEPTSVEDSIPLDELYMLVCVDSTHTTQPPYDCANPPSGTTITIVIDNPFVD